MFCLQITVHTAKLVAFNVFERNFDARVTNILIVTKDQVTVQYEKGHHEHQTHR